MLTAVDLECFRGDTAEWAVAVSLDDVVLDLSDCVVYMVARRNDASPVIFELTSLPGEGIVITGDPEDNVATARLRETDTLGLSNQLTKLSYAVRVVNTVTGDANTTAFGTLTVLPSAAPA